MDFCALCPRVNACIPEDGPDDADLLFIGEAPGPQEDRVAKKRPPGRPFIGKTGEEVDRHYLPLAGLQRGNVLFTNAIRCLPVSAGGKLNPQRQKDLALLQSCAQHHLYPLIKRARPKVIIPMGAFANRAVGGELLLDLSHGIPQRRDFMGARVFPMYHPALGIHEPKKMLYIRSDWHRLRGYLSGRYVHPQDGYPEVDYQEVTDETELATLDPSQPVACDTESRRGGIPYCFTYSQEPGTGRLLSAARPDLMAALSRRLKRFKAPILFHNWLYDWPITEALGLGIPAARVVDTMALVFHLGNLPQGLKALAYRELGMKMEDFEDVVTPYSRERVLDYYTIAADTVWPKPEEELVFDEKTAAYKLYRPQSMNTKFKRFFTDYSKNEEKDVFNMWESNWVEQQAMIEAVMGPWPGMCISHVPFEKVLYYACRDVDALIRLYPVLMAMRKRVRKFSQELWRAA